MTRPISKNVDYFPHYIRKTPELKLIMHNHKSEGYMALYDQTHLQVGVSGYNLNTPNMFNGFLVDSLYSRFCLFGKGFIFFLIFWDWGKFCPS